MKTQTLEGAHFRNMSGHCITMCFMRAVKFPVLYRYFDLPAISSFKKNMQLAEQRLESGSLGKSLSALPIITGVFA